MSYRLVDSLLPANLYDATNDLDYESSLPDDENELLHLVGFILRRNQNLLCLHLSDPLLDFTKTNKFKKL